MLRQATVAASLPDRCAHGVGLWIVQGGCSCQTADVAMTGKCDHPPEMRTIDNGSPETFYPREGCLQCNQWLQLVRCRQDARYSVTRVRRGKILQLTSAGFVAMMHELDRPSDTEEFERDYVSYGDRELIRVDALFTEKHGFRTANDGGRSRVSWLEFDGSAMEPVR